jgi:hypothetical protein
VFGVADCVAYNTNKNGGREGRIRQSVVRAVELRIAAACARVSHLFLLTKSESVSQITMHRAREVSSKKPGKEHARDDDNAS